MFRRGRPRAIRCLICSQKCSNQQKSLGRVPGANNCQILEAQLRQIFVVRELLGLSRDLCIKFLQDDGEGGNPENWFQLCEDCTKDKVGKAWELHQMIVELQLKLKMIKTEIMEVMKAELKNQRSSGLVVVERLIKRNIFPDLVQVDDKAEVKVEHDELFLEKGLTPELPQDEGDDPLFSPECADDDLDDEDYEDTKRLQRKQATRNINSFKRTLIKRGRPFGAKTKRHFPQRPFPPHLTTKGTVRKYKTVPVKSIGEIDHNLTVKGAPRKTKRHPKIDKTTNPNMYINRYGEIAVKSFTWNKCSLCPAKYKETEEFETHVALHEIRKEQGLGPLDCDICKFPAIDTSQLEIHRIERHQKQFRNKTTHHKCTKCPYKSFTWKLLKAHVEKEHPGLTEQELEELGVRLKCPACSKEYSDLISFERHKRQNHPELVGFKAERVQCNQCSIFFNSDLALKLHISNVHTTLSRFICDVCGKGFRYQKKLDVHKQTHDKTRNFVCHICGCDYLQKMSLDSHYKSNHPETLDPEAVPRSQPKIYKCKYCDFTTPYSAIRKRHLETHKDQSGVKCDLCERRYINITGLKLHMKLNHPPEKVEVACPSCLKVFSTEIGMKDHLKRYCKVAKMTSELSSTTTQMPSEELETNN